jgi:hypothetical protein
LETPRRQFSLESSINDIVRTFRQRIVAFRASVVFKSFTLFPSFSLFPALNHAQARRGNRLVKGVRLKMIGQTTAHRRFAGFAANCTAPDGVIDRKRRH